MSSKPNFNDSFRHDQPAISPSNPRNGPSDSYLDVANFPPPSRRSSHASIFSDLSDLDYMSNEHNTGLLQRTVSNVSNVSAYSNAGPTSFRQRLRNIYYQNYGAMLVLLSQVFGSGMNISTRLLEQPGAHGPPMHPFQILFTRQSLTALLCTVYALYTKSIPYFPLGPPDRKVRLLLVCRGLFGFFGVFGLYFSLLYLPLSEATVLTFLAPILTCYICSILLPGETFGRQQQLAGVVSFIGVVFIAQPVTLFSSFASPPSQTVTDGVDGTVAPTNGTSSSSPLSHDPIQPTPGQHLLAIALAMVGVCGATGAMTSIRAIGTRAHAFISINYFTVWSSIVSLLALIIFPDVSFRLPGNLLEWALLLSLGICGFIMQSLLTMGLAYGGPANSPEPKSLPSSNLTTADRTRLGSKAVEDDIEMQTQPISPDQPSSSVSHLQPTTPTHSRKSKPKPHPSGNRATSMVYCQMLFALAADKIIFGTTLSLWSWIGSGLILTGAVWVAAANDGSKSKKSDSVRGSGSERHREERRSKTRDGEDSEREEEQIGLLGDDHLDRDAHVEDPEDDRGDYNTGVSLSTRATSSSSSSSSSSSASALASASSHHRPHP